MPVYPRFDRSTIGLVVPPGGMPSVPIDLLERAAPLFGLADAPDDGVQLHVGDRLAADVLERQRDGGQSLFMPFSTPASNQPVLHLDRLDQLA